MYSTWTIEWTIGNLGQEIRQPSNPYANLLECGLQRSQINALNALIPSLAPDNSKEPRGSMGLGDNYSLLWERDRTGHPYDGIVGQLVEDFIHDAEVGLGQVPENHSGHAKLVRWACLRLPTGQVARSAWKEALKLLDNLRRSQCVNMKVLYTILENWPH